MIIIIIKSWESKKVNSKSSIKYHRRRTHPMNCKCVSHSNLKMRPDTSALQRHVPSTIITTPAASVKDFELLRRFLSDFEAQREYQYSPLKGFRSRERNTQNAKSFRVPEKTKKDVLDTAINRNDSLGV